MVRIHPVTARLSGISLDRPACADKLLRVLTLEPLGAPRGIVLFGAGAGGDPRRYRDLLDGFVDAGHVVLAPTNERFDPRTVTTEQLQGRVESLISALADYHHADCRSLRLVTQWGAGRPYVSLARNRGAATGSRSQLLLRNE